MIEPWLGNNWGTPNNIFNGVKLWVLGESGHSDEDQIGDQPSNYLKETVEIFLTKRPAYRFHTILTTLLAGEEAAWKVSDERRRAVWESIGFCNYVPVIAAQYSREKPTPEMFKNGTNSFAAILQKYEPQAILVCGFNTWGWMWWGRGGQERPWETPSPCWIGPAIAGRIKHPSTGFVYAKWRPVLDQLLLDARRGRTVEFPVKQDDVNDESSDQQ